MTSEDPLSRQADQINLQLLVYQLGELKVLVEKGFDRMEGRFDRAEERITSLERFRERVETREAAEAEASGVVTSRWVPIGLAIFTAGMTILLFLIGGAHG